MVGARTACQARVQAGVATFSLAVRGDIVKRRPRLECRMFAPPDRRASGTPCGGRTSPSFVQPDRSCCSCLVNRWGRIVLPSLDRMPEWRSSTLICTYIRTSRAPPAGSAIWNTWPSGPARRAWPSSGPAISPTRNGWTKSPIDWGRRGRSVPSSAGAAARGRARIGVSGNARGPVHAPGGDLDDLQAGRRRRARYTT